MNHRNKFTSRTHITAMLNCYDTIEKKDVFDLLLVF